MHRGKSVFIATVGEQSRAEETLKPLERACLLYIGLIGHLCCKCLSDRNKRRIRIGVAWHSDGLCMSHIVSDLCQVLEVTHWDVT